MKMKHVKPRSFGLLPLLALVLTLCCSLSAAAQTFDAQFPEETLLSRVKKISEQGNSTVLADEQLVGSTRVLALAAKGITAEQALARSLESTSFSYKKTAATSYVIVKKSTAPQPAAPRGKGTLSGTVVDSKGFPVPGATVIVAGTQTGTSTDVKGHYTLELAAKTVGVEISCISYQPMKISDVRIAAGKTTPLDVVLQDGSTELEEVVVTATYNKASANGLYAKQKARTVMSDGISADLIKKTSDNNVAQVLGRVSGVTIDNGKYVNIRGMGERYNNVQLNGATLPSTEPNKRNFAFDVLPSGLIDNITIAKTFTPDLPGEFTGGLVEVNTLAVPTEQIIQLSVGTGINTNSTGKNFWSNTRFKSDYLFGNIGDRQWYTGRSDEQGIADRKRAGQMNTYGFQRFKAAPVQNYALTVGLPFDLGRGHKLGVVASLTYRNEQNTEDYKEMRSYKNDSLNGPGKRYKFVTQTGAVANVGWQSPKHKITWRNMFNNRFSHTNLERYIWQYTTQFNTYEQYSTPLQSRLWQTQLDGEHKLFGERLIASWNASYNQVTRINPDDRYAQASVQGDTSQGVENAFLNWMSSVTSSQFGVSDGHLMYSNLTEKKKTAGFDLEYPFTVGGNKQTLKAGYLGTFRNADFQQKYLHAIFPTPSGDPAKDEAEEYEQRYAAFKELCNSNPNLQEFYDPKNFESGAISYASSGVGSSEGAEFYEGKQNIHAAYLMGEFSFLRKFHLTAGFRMESAKTDVFTNFYDKNNTSGGSGYKDSLAVVKKVDWLPAATLVYNITDNFNARFAYSRTIARPDFRELTPCKYYNVDDRITVVGTGQIKQSFTDNYDLRLEWYPAPGEVVSVSAFYKKFNLPVENVTYQTIDLNYNLYPFNLDEATVKGIELNVRKSLGFLAPGSFLKDIYLSGNATLLKGNVEYNMNQLLTSIDGQEGDKAGTSDRNRPLQGLAPYTVNAGLAYQGNIFGAAVNYGRSGRKLLFAGLYEKYDQYEASRDVLDLQVSARLLKNRMEIKFNASDLFNQDMIVYQNCSPSKTDRDPANDKANVDLTSDMNYNSGDWVLSRIKKGVNLSLSVSYKF